MPRTWDLIPNSWHSSEKVSPDLHSWRDVLTSSSVFPRQETIPMPVTTTRFKPATAMWSSVDEDGEAVDDVVLDLECCDT